MWPLCRRVKELEDDAAWAERMQSGRRMMGAGRGALNIHKSHCMLVLLKASFNHFGLPFLVHATTADIQNHE